MIGIDILENQRIRDLAKNPKFEDTFLTANEKKYISKFEDKTERLTGHFCIKEAVQKAFACPKELSFKSFEIAHHENGAPYVVFDSSVQEIAKNKAVEISVSHSKTVTVAVAVVVDLMQNFCQCK